LQIFVFPFEGKETKGFGGKFLNASVGVLLLFSLLNFCSKIDQNMRFITVFLLTYCFYSCENPPSETRAERIAKGICDCSTQLLNLNKQAANASGNIDFEAIQAEFGKARACIVNQRMKPEDLPEVQKALTVKCPELAAEAEMLGELLGTGQ
jgi:hypothetical protein